MTAQRRAISATTEVFLMLPRWAGCLIAAVLLILAAFLLVPALLPAGGVAAFCYYALLIVGVAVGAYGIYLALAGR